MKKILFLFLLPAFLFSGCASLKKGSSRMDDRTSEIVVREEKVRTVEEVGPDVFHHYYVIIGSFRILDNARTFKEDLRIEHFPAVLLENEDGLYRVSVGAYNEEAPARSQIAQIRSQHDKYDDVWLLIRKR